MAFGNCYFWKDRWILACAGMTRADAVVRFVDSRLRGNDKDAENKFSMTSKGMDCLTFVCKDVERGVALDERLAPPLNIRVSQLTHLYQWILMVSLFKNREYLNHG